ncbi:hypothetical protein [Alkalimonas amylolytica]|uniref:hypothetical protein n=1 Tax=Alkalimonas amylolytica TaxID=152573 RepID=UPI000B831BAC|nr:hypothetical protein [Alkalimonas amylolytica]
MNNKNENAHLLTVNAGTAEKVKGVINCHAPDTPAQQIKAIKVKLKKPLTPPPKNNLHCSAILTTASLKDDFYETTQQDCFVPSVINAYY